MVRFSTLNVGDDLKRQEMGDQKSRAYKEVAGASEDENV